MKIHSPRKLPLSILIYAYQTNLNSKMTNKYRTIDTEILLMGVSWVSLICSIWISPTDWQWHLLAGQHLWSLRYVVDMPIKKSAVIKSVGLPPGGALRKRSLASPVSTPWGIFSLTVTFWHAATRTMHTEKIPLGFGLGVTKSGKNNNAKTVSVDYSVINRHEVIVMVLCKCKQ